MEDVKLVQSMATSQETVLRIRMKKDFLEVAIIVEDMAT